MAVWKINESTLTAIGNAIREKTGGSALINPENMATEIESIESGGGSGLTLFTEYTAPEGVHAIRIDFTQEMLNAVGLLFVMNGTTSANEWIYPTFDTTNKTNLYLPQRQNYQNCFLSASRTMTGGNFVMANQNGSNSVSSASPTYIYFQPYYDSSVFNSGFNIKVYGVNLP